jgi:hypothetical protein
VGSEAYLKLLFTGEDAIFHRPCSKQIETLKGIKGVLGSHKKLKRHNVEELFSNFRKHRWMYLLLAEACGTKIML